MKAHHKFGVSLTLLLATAMAGGTAHAADQGFFVELGAGISKVDVPSFDLPGASVDDEDMFFSVGVGYKINEMFALEGGYVDLGEASLTYGPYSATSSADGFYFGPRLTLQVSPQVSLYGRIGMLAWDGETTTNFGMSSSDDGTDPYFGVGAAFKVSGQVSLGVDWTRYGIETAGEDVDVDTFGGKLTFNF